MSLILEALKKSDAERQRSASEQQHVPAAGYRRGRSLARAAMLLIAIAVSIAIGWYASRQSGEPETTTVSTETQALPESARTESPPTAQTADLPVEPADAPDEAELDPAPSDPSLDDSKQSDQSNPVKEQTVVDLNPWSEPLVADLDLIAPVPPAAAPDAVVMTTGSKRDTLPTFSQLPTALQSEIGDLTLNVLVFAEQAADRFVLINLRRYQVGDKVTDQVLVAEIRADGVVLDYDGRLFLLDTRF